MDGTDYPYCTCLQDDVLLSGQFIANGSSKNYHWVMTNWSSINVPDELRPSLTIETLPCNGSVNLYVMGPTIWSPPFPNVALPNIRGRTKWNSTLPASPNSISFTLTAAQYYITTHGLANSTYGIIARINAAKTPTTGAAGNLSITTPLSNNNAVGAGGLGLDVTFTYAETTFGNETSYLYKVYKVPNIVGSPCGDTNSSVDPLCIMATHCGLESTVGMTNESDWLTDPGPPGPGRTRTVSVYGLEQDQSYTFNVAVMDPYTGISRVYVGTRGTPTYTRATAAASNTTIIAIASSAGAAFLALVVCIVWARSRLTKRMHHYRATKAGAAGVTADGETKIGETGTRSFGRVIRNVATRVQRVFLRRFLR